MSKILITGCPRSGTGYAAKCAQSIGLDLGHESMGLSGTVDWHKATLTHGYQIVIHLVRSPLPCISSIAETISKKSWDYIYKKVQVDFERELRETCKPEDSPLVRAMKLWIDWNAICKEKAHYTIKVEDLPKMFPDIPINTNSRSHKDYSFLDLRKADIGIADRIFHVHAPDYGY